MFDAGVAREVVLNQERDALMDRDTGKDLAKLAATLRAIADQLSPPDATRDPGATDLCRHVRCSREASLELVIREAILTIENTKSSFRSKVLQDLKEKLARSLNR